MDGDGVPWVVRRFSAMRDGGCSPVIVVLGASASEAVELLPDAAWPVVATAWAEGMGASLRTGLATAAGLDPVPDAVLVALVDLPGLTADAVARVAGRARPSSLAQAAYGGEPGHPVLLGRDHWPGVLGVAEGDRGARDYLAGRAVAQVECGDVGSGADVDRR